MTYAISELQANPPVKVRHLPEFENRELMRSFTVNLNEGHRKLKTGKVFKMFEIREPRLAD